MISDDDLKKIEGTSKSGHWYVHNGFLGWAYGSPLNPTPISRSTAKNILQRIVGSRHTDAISRLVVFPNALDYADDGDSLCIATGGNRLIAYLPKLECVFEPSYKEAGIQNYEF